MASSAPLAVSAARRRQKQPSRRFARDAARNHLAACYHEAGHAVFAYEVGWWVNSEGVEVGPAQYTGLGCRDIDYTPWRRAWVFMAGLMAECRFLRLGSSARREDLAPILAAIRAGRSPPGDECEILHALVEQFPNAADADLIDLYHEYQQVLLKEMGKGSALWDRVRRVARALSRKGTLTPDEVEALL